jgi:hypothetical protein
LFGINTLFEMISSCPDVVISLIGQKIADNDRDIGKKYQKIPSPSWHFKLDSIDISKGLFLIAQRISNIVLFVRISQT